MTAPLSTVSVSPSRTQSPLLWVTWVGTGIGLLLVPGIVLGQPIIARQFNTSNGSGLLPSIIGIVIIAVVWLLTPVPLKRKVVALILLAVALILLPAAIGLIGQGLGLRLSLLIASPISIAIALSGWFTLRARSGRSYAALPVAVLSALVAFVPGIQLIWPILVVVPVAVAWIGWLLGRDSTNVRRAEQAAAREQASVASTAQAIQQWQSAYALANPGQPIPAPPLVIGAPMGYGAAGRTNVLAILALVFGILGGILAIVFGHIALSQIKRSGENGRGMAIAGLILGYLWLVVSLALIVIPALLLLSR